MDVQPFASANEGAEEVAATPGSFYRRRNRPGWPMGRMSSSTPSSQLRFSVQSFLYAQKNSLNEFEFI